MPLASWGTPGMVVGQQAAVGILNLRAGDGSFPSNPEVFVGGTEPGEWRPTPPAFAPMAAPWLGDCRSLHPQGLHAALGVAPSAALAERRIRP